MNFPIQMANVNNKILRVLVSDKVRSVKGSIFKNVFTNITFCLHFLETYPNKTLEVVIPCNACS